MLSEAPDLNTEHRQLLQIVTRESERLNAIITDFLAYSRSKHISFVASTCFRCSKTLSRCWNIA